MAPSSEPISQQIVAAVVARLNTISAGSAYWYTPGSIVTDAQRVNDVRQFPSYGVWVTSESPVDEDNSDVHAALGLEVEVWISDPTDRLQALRRACADVTVALAVDQRWGLSSTVVRTTAPAVAVTDPADLDAPFAHASLTFTVFYDRVRTAA